MARDPYDFELPLGIIFHDLIESVEYGGENALSRLSSWLLCGGACCLTIDEDVALWIVVYVILPHCDA